MGSNDVPPAHIPSHVVPTSNALLQVGGTLWTICYILFVRDALRTKSYGMPLFALSLNFGWELVYALYVVESPLERFVFTVWLFIDCGLIYSVLNHAKYEWKHSPWVANNIKFVLTACVAVAVAGHWTFAKWWIDNDIGKKEGKIYRGVLGPDTTELGFWTAIFCQAYLSATSLIQLLVRQHSGGVSWGVWLVITSKDTDCIHVADRWFRVTRTLGTIIGLYLNYGWEWWFWTEAHKYVVSPFALFLFSTGLISDILYAFVLWNVRGTERVLQDGRKEARYGIKERDKDL